MTADTKLTERIPVTLVTGFLGSGKTTLINRALKAPELSRTAVVVNEFGQVGLDHKLYANSNDTVIVLENGCLCCTVRSDLVSTLNDLFRSRQAGKIPPFDHVVIETSGLAEPGAVLQAFLSEPTLDGVYRIASVLTLVDAVNWESTLANHDEAARQVALADHILITKQDAVAESSVEQLADLRASLRKSNPSAIVLENSDELDLVSLLKPTGFDPANPSANPLPWLNAEAYAGSHAHKSFGGSAFQAVENPIENFVLTRNEPMSRDELQFLLDGISQNLGPGLLRVKGLVNVAEEPGKPAVIQGVQHLLHNMTWLEKWPDNDQKTRVVFITQGIVRGKLEEIIELLDRVSKRTFEARERGRLAREVGLQAKAMEETRS
jgi:G3E family GTPase